MRVKYKFGEFYSKQETVESYDGIRLRYFHRRIHRKLERFAAVFYLRKKSSILEVGCGTGFVTEELGKYGGVTAIDPSEHMLDLAKMRVGNKAKFEKKGVFDMKYKNEFDSVVSFRVLNHFDDKNVIKALKKMKDAVKKNGLIVFTLENKSYLRGFIQLIFSRNKAPSYKHSLDDIDILTKEAGLKIKDILAIQHTWLLLPLHFIGEIIRSKKYELNSLI
ncbi:class I SAM-dependent methyltransferase [Candidatus Woesearchaeota archaeon]|nr:class I SAM-dependent methyltransferase [Candidatus Woesearchaeota archaeon]